MERLLDGTGFERHVKGQVAVSFAGNGQQAREKIRNDDFEFGTVIIIHANQDLITSKTL
jgi:hypothetical protein